MKIKEATGKPGIIFPTANNYGGWMFSCLAWSYGVDFMEKGEDGKWKATFNTPEEAEALRYMKDLKWKYDVLPNNAIIDGTEFYKTFAIGNAAMLMAADIQPEEPVCAQELYGILDSCLQEVLTNENADCAAILEKANNDFQQNYLDNLTY